MDLYHLKLFHIVARNLSFSKAAEELHISQPAISMQIKSLEEEIGIILFERYGRTISLSKEGQVVYSYTQKIFDILNDMESEINIFKGKMSGEIRIGASNTPGVYVLPQIMGMFKEKHPDVTIILNIGNTQEIQEKLVQDELDFAIVGGEVELYKTFTVERLVEDIMVLVVSPLNALSNYEYIDVNMLSKQQYITHVETSQLYKLVEKIFLKLKLPLNIIMTLGSVEAIKHAVAANLGVAFTPYTAVAEEIKNKTLSRVNVENKVWKYPYNLVYHNKKVFNAPMLIMLEMIRNNIKRIVTTK